MRVGLTKGNVNVIVGMSGTPLVDSEGKIIRDEKGNVGDGNFILTSKGARLLAYALLEASELVKDK